MDSCVAQAVNVKVALTTNTQVRDKYNSQCVFFLFFGGGGILLIERTGILYILSYFE